jgi:hypothetical protein
MQLLPPPAHYYGYIFSFSCVSYFYYYMVCYIPLLVNEHLFEFVAQRRDDIRAAAAAAHALISFFRSTGWRLMCICEIIIITCRLCCKTWAHLYYLGLLQTSKRPFQQLIAEFSSQILNY